MKVSTLIKYFGSFILVVVGLPMLITSTMDLGYEIGKSESSEETT